MTGREPQINLALLECRGACRGITEHVRSGKVYRCLHCRRYRKAPKDTLSIRESRCDGERRASSSLLRYATRFDPSRTRRPKTWQ